MQDLSQANLRRLNLANCGSLVEVPALRFEQAFDECVGQEEKVRSTMEQSYWRSQAFSMMENSYWRPQETQAFLSIPEVCDYSLHLGWCLNLKLLSEMCGNIRSICLRYTAVEELHPSVWSLENLSHLDLNSCRGLKNLPSNICQLESLEHLNLGGCSTIDKFPELPKNLRMSHLSGTAIEQVPSSSFECLPNLEVLYLENCTRLKSLPTSIYKLESLVTLNLSDCTNFESFPEILEPMECLRILNLDGTRIRELHSSIENLTRLRLLFLRECENLELVPNNMYNIRCLEYLDLSKCPKLVSLPALSVGFHCKIEVDLSYNSILKVPHWNSGLSSLTLLDLTDITTGRRHVSMEQLFNMILFSRGNNETGDFQMDSLLAKPQACRCAPMDNSNFSNFLFCGCSRFDEAECTNMAAKFLLIVLWEAIWFKMKEIEQEKIIFPRINLCCPGNEIPWWFSDQSKGSSIQIKLSPTWHNPDFLGFAFCFVVEFEHYCFDVKHLNCCCEYHLKTNHGEGYSSVWRSQRPEKAEWVKEIKFLNSDHMFMGLLCEDCYDFRDVVDMSFEFCLEPFDWEALVENGKYKVKECGIRTLYLQDAEEFGVIEYISQNASLLWTSPGITLSSEQPVQYISFAELMEAQELIGIQF